jgi:hypothetical protein
MRDDTGSATGHREDVRVMTRQHGTLVRKKSAPHRREERVPDAAGIKGGFRITLSDGSWWWSPGMYVLHGLRAAQMRRIVPSTRFVLTHRHPADRAAMIEAWTQLITDGPLVAFRYRIVGVDGVVRPVYAMASIDHGADGSPTVVTGVLQLESASG